jgi:phosphopantetheinyl transferase (holo-ACP synthase)
MEYHKMNKPQIRIYTNNGEFIDREMNDAEYEQYTKDQAEFLAKREAELEATAKRQALFDKLGITEEEAKLLLG